MTFLAADVGVPLWVALLGSLTSFVIGLLMWWVKHREVDRDAEDRDKNRELGEIKEALLAWRSMVRQQASHLVQQDERLNAISRRLDQATARHRACEADLVRMRHALTKMGVPMDDLVPMRRADDRHPESED